MNNKKYDLKQFRAERGCLSYIFSDKETKEAIIIDPSSEINTDDYLNYLKDNSLSLKYIIDTHTHADHISSSQELKEKTSAKILMHSKSPTPRKDIAIDDSYTLKLGALDIEIFYTPGHTNESIVIYHDDVLFSGDTLLIEGTGRTDFQNGSSKDLYESLQKILKLNNDVKIYPAHDYKNRVNSTISKEKELNPRLKLSQSEFIESMDKHHPKLPELFEKSIEENTK